jgi:hypothetical protein
MECGACRRSADEQRALPAELAGLAAAVVRGRADRGLSTELRGRIDKELWLALRAARLARVGLTDWLA